MRNALLLVVLAIPTADFGQYGMAIAYSLGIFERALQPFPAALDAYRQAVAARGARRMQPVP